MSPPFDSPELCKLTCWPTSRFPPRHKTPEFIVFASLLRMTTKYGFTSVRDQLVEDLRGAYPTKWEDFQGAKVLGEDIFGSPKPHPNTVLNLFEAENVRAAVPFAAYRASIGGVSALMSYKPGTILPPRTLATTIHGMHILRSSASDAARVAVYREYPRVCPDKSCALSVEDSLTEERMVAMERIYSVVIGQREGGPLSSPPSWSTSSAQNVRSVWRWLTPPGAQLFGRNSHPHSVSLEVGRTCNP